MDFCSMRVIHKVFKPTLKIKCQLLTWEFRTTFDVEPSAREVQEKFAGEMPQLLTRVGDICRIKLLPMVSFNASEGRLWRYMVVVPQECCLKKNRYLPEQICLMALASEFMMTRQQDNSGNCVFWVLLENTLYILVYMEGRLCHWSEETGYKSSVDFPRETLIKNRLERFRKFLRQDSLFSRGEHYEFVELKLGAEGFPRTLFLAASRDPFFKKRDCNENLQENRSLGKYLWGLSLVLLVFFAVQFIFYLENKVKLDALVEIPDVEEVLLDLPPLEESTEELRLLPSVLPDVPLVQRRKFDCNAPVLRLKGIVGDRLAFVEYENQSATIKVGDSLGEYVVQNIKRDRIIMACDRDSLEIAFQ